MMNRMNILSGFASRFNGLVAKQPVRGLVTRTRSRLSGHDHGHGHGKPPGPYDAPHHATNNQEAFLFGIDPKVPYKWKGWEPIVAVVYAVGFGLMVAIIRNPELDSYTDWARAEAIERDRIRAAGGTVEWGVWYHPGNKVVYDTTDYSPATN